MPREDRRSFGYRFVTCGDPRGVVECASIRRSRDKNRDMIGEVKSLVRLPREAEIGRCSDVVQLSKVSKGARKPKRMIDTWSRGGSFDDQSKDITKDLLKGAFDLQESLILLGRLKEATKYVAQLKHKAELSSEGIQSDERFQKSRISVDKASSGTYKFRRKEHDSVRDVPSTSSSQSSMIDGDDVACYTESETFSSAIKQKGSASRSNVIAKLMGLDEIPANKRPALDTRFNVPRLGREPRSLKAILEGMQSKGLLKSDSVGNRKSGNDDHPPIVLIKPFAAPVMKGNEHLVQEDRILRTDEVFRKFSNGQEKIDRSARKQVDSKTKQGGHSKKQLSAQVSRRLHTSDAVDRKHRAGQKVMKNSGRYSKEGSPSRKRLQDPNKLKNDTSNPQSRSPKNVPNRRILEDHQTTSRDRDRRRSLKARHMNITRHKDKDNRQNQIDAVGCEKFDPVTTEISSTMPTSTSVEETDQAILLDSKNKQSDSDSEDRHVHSIGGDQCRDFMKWRDEKALLWSDSSFLARLETLFESSGIHPIIHNLKSNDKNKPRSVTEKLYLDCANELIEVRRLQFPWNIDSITLSVDKVIEEVCDGIDDLNGRCEFADGHLSTDGFSTLLKRDMLSTGIVIGAWELGWKEGFSREDVKRVVIDLEKMILGLLIEEAIALAASVSVETASLYSGA